MRYSKELRIGIIGAGPAGLGAAEALKQLGYKNITVLEKSPRAGGMSLSLHYPGKGDKDIVYELGSLVPLSSAILFRLIKRYGLHIGKSNLENGKQSNKVPMIVYSLEERKAIVDFKKNWFGQPISVALIQDMIKLGWSIFRYRKLARPGFKDLSPELYRELCIPYKQWLDERHFKVLRNLLYFLGIIITFGNHDQKDDLPALPVIKLFLRFLTFPPRILNGQFIFMREGYQELWNRVAKEHHVLFNVDIQKITRKPDEIEVDLGDKKLVFDKLIFTPSLTKAMKIVAITEEERKLFSKVKYYPGWRAAFLARGLPHDGVYSFYEPYMMKEFGPGLQTFYPEGEVGDGVWLYSAMIFLNSQEGVRALLPEAEKILRDHFNGEVIEWLQLGYWPEYSPYFDCDALKENIYHKLDDLQGKNNTFYLGGTISWSTHPIVVEYAYAVVNKFF